MSDGYTCDTLFHACGMPGASPALGCPMGMDLTGCQPGNLRYVTPSVNSKFACKTSSGKKIQYECTPETLQPWRPVSNPETYSQSR